MKGMIRAWASRLLKTSNSFPEPLTDLPPDFLQVIKKVKSYTMTSPLRISALCSAVDYLVKHQIHGDFVECGVWRGGSMMAMLERLKFHQSFDRDLYLYDTFEGMSPPSSKDISHQGESAQAIFQNKQEKLNQAWCYATLEEVKQNLNAYHYPAEKIHYVKGKVEETIPKVLPESIALLRLDTDWYESTRHEMVHLFPRIVHGGVLIIDDYGHWQGARQAVDEYLQAQSVPILLNRIDYTGRLGIVLKH